MKLQQLMRVLPILACVAIIPASHAAPLYGITPFPYDLSAEAVQRTNTLIRDNSTVHALHLDDGIPWKEMLDKKTVPDAIQSEWDAWSREIPAGRPVYLGLAPLAKDRKSLSPPKGGSMPWVLKFAQFDDRIVKSSYLQYARLAVKQFKPSYLNLGIEAGELASRDPGDWDKFFALYTHVAQTLKRENPQMQIGISFGLQSLRKPDVAKRAKALVDASDFLCVSFYPHMSPFGEKFGDPALGEGAKSWREPLDWLRKYTNKPLAVCETGYSTQNAELKSFDLRIKGDLNLQASYVKELAEYASRDNYLFVIWFLATDYDQLFERMGGMTKANEVNLLWRNIGMFSGNLKPKPAWAVWQRVVGSKGKSPLTADSRPAAAVLPTIKGDVANTPAAVSGGFAVGFAAGAQQLFQAGGASTVALDNGAMRWQFTYQGNEWIWAARDIKDIPASGQRMRLRIKSDQDGPIFIQLEEQSGEAYFLQIQPQAKWQEVSVPLSSFAVDPAKRKDGVLQLGQISKIILADAGGRAGAKGPRSIWFADWRFD